MIHLSSARPVFSQANIALNWGAIERQGPGRAFFTRERLESWSRESFQVSNRIPVFFTNGSDTDLRERGIGGGTLGEFRGAAISSLARDQTLVTAHELGHAIGLLLHKEDCWPVTRFLMCSGDKYHIGTKFDESEIIQLRTFGSRIP